MTIANPIYDIVFKYLMEDERIARTILSALLKKEVVDVKVRPHEYTNENSNRMSMFRIDFGATVREADGQERLTLIEVQKTWLETETLRFRRYLGVHYSDARNMLDDHNALPMVAIYILAHQVGDIDEPVVYVNHKSYDYDGKELTKGIPNPFIDSLTHESIIVQVPLLHGQINNRLDMVLSVFDQQRQYEGEKGLLDIDANTYDGDTDMQRIIHRLLVAASDPDVRQTMNMEDEYYSVIEKRDTEILIRDKALAEQKVQIDEQKSQIDEQKSQIARQEAMLATSIKILTALGQSPEDISSQLGLDIEIVKKHTRRE